MGLTTVLALGAVASATEAVSDASGSSYQVPLGDTLARLSQQHAFRVDGVEHLDDRAARFQDGPLLQQLRLLLEAFDHIILQTPEGGVSRVLILGPKGAAAPLPPTQIHVPVASAPTGPIVLPTRRRGNQHLIQVELEGVGGRRLRREVLLDTGADALVLPASLIGSLGLGAAELVSREVQTANGRTQARYGQLPAVWLDGRRIGGVAVAFLDEGRLGSHGLLGMSVLGRFRITIDDQANQVLFDAP
jgi:predicted aspartyl protease